MKEELLPLVYGGMSGNGYLQVAEWKGIATFLICFLFGSLLRTGTLRIADMIRMPAGTIPSAPEKHQTIQQSKFPDQHYLRDCCYGFV